MPNNALRSNLDFGADECVLLGAGCVEGIRPHNVAVGALDGIQELGYGARALERPLDRNSQQANRRQYRAGSA